MRLLSEMEEAILSQGTVKKINIIFFLLAYVCSMSTHIYVWIYMVVHAWLYLWACEGDSGRLIALHLTIEVEAHTEIRDGESRLI